MTLKFDIGQRVQKIKGYKFPGIIIGTALKRDGRRLWLVECIASGAEGVCHIFGDNDLETVPDGHDHSFYLLEQVEE